MSEKDINPELEDVLNGATDDDQVDSEVENEAGTPEDILSEDQQDLQPQDEQDTEQQLRDDLAKEKDKFLRLFAEFENFKRRTSKERMDLFKTAGQEIMVAMLPVLDDFDRALKELAKSDDKEMFKGVELIRVKFREVLKSKGLEEVEVAKGDTFDAETHDAITQIPAPDAAMKGKIVDVIERGFKLGDRIIRHPKVVVGK